MMHWKVLLECAVLWSGAFKYTQLGLMEKIHYGAVSFCGVY